MSDQKTKLIMVLASLVVFAVGTVCGLLFANSGSVDRQKTVPSAPAGRAKPFQAPDPEVSPAKRMALLDSRIGTAAELVDDAFQRGKLRIEEKNWQKANDDFSTAIKTSEVNLAKNKNSDTRNLLAWSYQDRAYTFLMMKKYADGIKDLDRAIELRPKYRTNYINRAKAYRKLGQYDQADKDVATARTIPAVNDEYGGFE